MTRTHRTLAGATLVAAALSVTSCDKSVQPTEIYPAVAPSSLDADAGTWKMIVMTGPDQIVVPDPASPVSAAYKAEIAALKTAQANETPAQREAVAYWSSGGVLRWNEIERELVARYNLPPIPRADGS
jgi:hypothetical protein